METNIKYCVQNYVAHRIITKTAFISLLSVFFLLGFQG